MITQYHDLHINFDSAEVTCTVIRQNSADSHILSIYLYKHGKTVLPDPDWKVYISASKSDQTHRINLENISIAGNCIQVPVTEQILTAPCTANCELTICQKDNSVLYSNAFLLHVDSNAQDISTAAEAADYILASEKGAPGGVAELDNTGVVRSFQLPDFMPASDVYDWAKQAEKPSYTKEEIGLENVDNTSDMDKPVSTAQQAVLDTKVDVVDGKGLSSNDFTNDYKSKLDNVTDYRASSGNSTSKLYLLGAASQSSSGLRTYSNSNVHMSNGTLQVPRLELPPRSKAFEYTNSQPAYLTCGADDYLAHSSLSIVAPDNRAYESSDSHHYTSSLRFAPCYGAIYSTDSTLGTSSYPFRDIYSRSYITVTSDRNTKKNITPMTGDKLLSLFDAIEICRYQMTTPNPGITSPAPSRYHTGVIAQDVEEAIKEAGLDSQQFSAVKSEFFLNSLSSSNICGGWQVNKEGYDYSENTYQYKHGLDYEFFNEIIEKPISEFVFDSYREDIQYLMIEDNSKLTKNQPPVVINSIHLMTQDGTITELPLNGETLAYYEPEDSDFSHPLSAARLDEEGHLICQFGKMYSAVFLKLSDTSIRLKDYQSIIIDVDYVSEYKLNFLPAGTYQNANVWDRERNDKILYNYSFAYDEWYNIGMYALQETRKELKSLKETVSELIAHLNQ